MILKTYLLALLVIFIWASNFVAIKVGVGEIPPLALLALRFTTAGLIFLPFAKWPGWHQAIIITIVGIIMGPLHQGFLYVSLVDVPAGVMSILLQSNIIIVTLIGWLFLKETIGWRTWLGILIGILGVIILVDTPDTVVKPLAYFYGFVSAFFLALNYIGMKKIGNVHPTTYIVFLSLPTAPILILSSYLIEGTGWTTQFQDLNFLVIATVVLYQAIVLSASHILWQTLMVKHPVSQLVPLTLMVPVFSIIIAIAFLDEKITSEIIIGGTLTIAGVCVITLRKLRKSAKLQ